jgi:hypothetical protein
VRTNGLGEAFDLSFDFNEPINTSPGQHSISMYTIFNCVSSGCLAAQDTISVKVKDGSGSYSEVATISERTQDSAWHFNKFNFTLTENVAHVSKNKISFIIIYYYIKFYLLLIKFFK